MAETQPIEPRLMAAIQAVIEAMIWYVSRGREYDARCAAMAAAAGVINGTCGEDR